MYICSPKTRREFSSVGLEHLPYKQRVGGSTPSTPTKRPAGMRVFFVILQSGLAYFMSQTFIMNIGSTSFRTIAVLLCCVLLLSCSGRKARTMDGLNSLKEAGELSLLEYTMSTTFEETTDRWWLAGDESKVLFSCRAYCEYGLDMKEFDPEKVSIDRASNSISLTLPPVKRLHFSLPENEIKLVYARRKPFGEDYVNDAEARRRVKARGEREILRELDSLRLDREAAERGRTWFTAMLGDLGYENIEINFGSDGKVER